MAALVASGSWAAAAPGPLPRPASWRLNGGAPEPRAKLQATTVSESSLPYAAVLAGALAVAGRRQRRPALGSGRHGAVVRRALELPVKEPPVKTTVTIPGADIKEEIKQKRAEKYRLLLFNDPLNKREFVARCLMTICLLKESDAYQVMMKAHREGVAVVGTYAFETAEAYCEGLKNKGLTVDIVAADDDE
mmetsp:Transcript_87886/g.262073  ORF Transcript_87886/g.262073 Transcript_87886/m.262073 type:complete len:191 (-) Transcript_87886:99-671(-)